MMVQSSGSEGVLRIIKIFFLIFQQNISSAECYNVLSPFFEKLKKWGSKFASLNLV